MKNIAAIAKNFKDSFNIHDPKSREMRMGVYALLGLVSFFMTIMNIVTGKGMLTVVTGLFALLSAVDVLLTQSGKTGMRVAQLVFALQIVSMFVYFVISGNPEGFSVIWICMLPSLGLYFFGKKYGSMLCTLMFFLLLFFLWLPVGQDLLMYNYNKVFLMRFPVLYLAFFIMAYFFETIRTNIYENMLKAQNEYKKLFAYDQLTGVLNRQGMYAKLEEESIFSRNIGVIMLDIDHFKEVNDKYGHIAGDAVLKTIAGIIDDNDIITCRWGGEEFVLIYNMGVFKADDVEAMRRKISETIIHVDEKEISITVSMGVFETFISNTGEIDKLINIADEAMYEAKQSGRNRVVFSKKAAIN